MPQRKRQHVDCHELRALVEQAPDAYFLHDFNGHIIDVNRCTCETLGYSREELLELSVFEIEMDFDHAAAQLAWSAMVPGHGSTLAGQHRRQDGTVFPIEARVSVCVFGGERLYLVLARDLADRKLLKKPCAFRQSTTRPCLNRSTRDSASFRFSLTQKDIPMTTGFLR